MRRRSSTELRTQWMVSGPSATWRAHRSQRSALNERDQLDHEHLEAARALGVLECDLPRSVHRVLRGRGNRYGWSVDPAVSQRELARQEAAS